MSTFLLTYEHYCVLPLMSFILLLFLAGTLDNVPATVGGMNESPSFQPLKTVCRGRLMPPMVVLTPHCLSGSS